MAGHFQQRGIHVGHVGVVFGVFVQPPAGDGFNRFQRRSGLGFGIDGAEKAAHIGLGGLH